MIRLENVYFETTDHKYLLSDVNIFISSGSVVSIVGEHSFGKTRLLKTIAMLEKPKKGHIYIMGKNISKLNHKEISDLHSQIGIVFEDNLFINNLNVNDNILLPLILRKENKKEINLALKELSPWLNLDTIIKKKINTLSSSEKKLVQFARAIIVRPRILLLDNFFLNIDKAIEKKIVYLIMALNRIGTTIIIFGQEPLYQKINFSIRYSILNKQLKEL